ncbi:unnamed protein product, partial [Chrysoparadoxa australica]
DNVPWAEDIGGVSLPLRAPEQGGGGGRAGGRRVRFDTDTSIETECSEGNEGAKRGQKKCTKLRGFRLACSQLMSLVWKSLLIKKSDWKQTMCEILLPVAMMSVLVWLKGLVVEMTAPPVAYVCGQAYPWQYQNDLSTASMLTGPFPGCLVRPSSCHEDER